MNLVEFVAALKTAKEQLEKETKGLRITLDSHYGLNRAELVEGVALCFRVCLFDYSQEIRIYEKWESTDCQKYLDKMYQFIKVSKCKVAIDEAFKTEEK
jgi:hypothetical protein